MCRRRAVVRMLATAGWRALIGNRHGALPSIETFCPICLFSYMDPNFQSVLGKNLFSGKIVEIWVATPGRNENSFLPRRLTSVAVSYESFKPRRFRRLFTFSPLLIPLYLAVRLQFLHYRSIDVTQTFLGIFFIVQKKKKNILIKNKKEK